MTTTSLCIALATCAALAGAAQAAPMAALSNVTGYSLGDNGGTLVRMNDLTNPSAATGVPLADGDGVDVPLSALAYRPQTGELYGFSQQKNAVYLVRPDTGVVSQVAATSDGVSVGEIGFDFNNQVDAARIVTTAEDNLVFFPNNTPANIARFTDLFYGPGDPNAGLNPGVFANAYTNAVPNASTTQQFVLDGEWDILATLANNAGVLTTVGEVWSDGDRLDFSSTGGFDIVSRFEGDNTALALLTTVDGPGLYLLPLMADMNGKVNATFLGAARTPFGTLDGFAAAPAPVPLPAAGWFLVAGVSSMFLLGRRRQMR